MKYVNPGAFLKASATFGCLSFWSLPSFASEPPASTGAIEPSEALSASISTTSLPRQSVETDIVIEPASELLNSSQGSLGQLSQLWQPAQHSENYSTVVSAPNSSWTDALGHNANSAQSNSFDESVLTDPLVAQVSGLDMESDPLVETFDEPILNGDGIIQENRPSITTPKRDHYSTTAESFYYNWTDELGNSGSQLVVPLTATYQRDQFDVGLRTAYIYSNFDGVLLLDGQNIGSRSGSVSTLSDTSLSAAYTLPVGDRLSTRFNLDVNVPTGSATLKGDEKNAIMDGSLVQQTRFGEGWNVAPGASISYAVTDKDTIGVGLSHIFKGKFDPNGDVENDTIDPGNETVATLQYSHTARNWLLLSGLIYTHYGVTDRGGEEYYRNGNRLDANTTLIFKPFDGSQVQLSGRYFTQGENDVVNFFSGNLEKESANSNGNSFYLSLDWGIDTGQQQKGTVHVLADYLDTEANSYDRINDLFNAGRSKFSAGLGYDYAFSNSNQASIQAKYFQVLDEATPLTQQDIESNGLQLSVSYNHQF